MLAIREEELNMVNGGFEIAGLNVWPKFYEGDWVISKSEPDAGVGVVVAREYHDGWFYYVSMDAGRLYAPESDLEYAYTK